MSDVQSIEQAREEAAAKGLLVVLPDSHELFVDIDDKFSMKVFERGLLALQDFWPAKVVRKTPSPSGRPNRFHIVVQIDRKASLTRAERLTLQALLGSDPKREILGHVQLREGETEVTRFFEKPEAAE